MPAGLFITLEGGEGAGKTTLADKLVHVLISKGYEVVKTREPGGSKLGNYIRQWLLDKSLDITLGQQAELLLFLAARAQHIEEIIKPSLEAGKAVICDRFNDSTIAYQGVARGLGFTKVEQLCTLVCDGIKPDITFYLDISPYVGLNRTRRSEKENAKKGQLDRIEAEKMEFHNLVREGFLKLARENPKRIHTIDASLSPKAVFEKALAIVNEKLQNLHH